MARETRVEFNHSQRRRDNFYRGRFHDLQNSSFELCQCVWTGKLALFPARWSACLLWREVKGLVIPGLGLDQKPTTLGVGHFLGLKQNPPGGRLKFGRGFPEDVRHIIPSHLDLDHAGGIVDFPGRSTCLMRPHPRFESQLYANAARHGKWHIQHEAKHGLDLRRCKLWKACHPKS